MTSTESVRGAQQSLLQGLRHSYPDSTFLALGQTVFWDEPVKAALRVLLDESGIGGEMLVGVHDTDYFAKTRLRRAGSGRFSLMPHNDGFTRDLWSAAGEVSTLFGSETMPRRQDYLKYGVPFYRLARNHPDGYQKFLDEVTEAWGWRGLVYTGSRDLIVSRLPLRDVGAGIMEMLAFGFENAIQQIAPNCCCNEAHGVAEKIANWCREYCQTYPDRFLTDLFQHLLPQIYTLLLGRNPQNVRVDGTASLLRFTPHTCSLPRFRFVDLFLQSETRELAANAYNNAVAGSTIYTLDKFGEGALPFDVIVPEKGRGTLRVTPRVVFIESPQPVAIGLKKPIESIQELAAVLNHRLGDGITLVGKAVTLISMLAQEFIFVFNEEGSQYVTRTRQMNDEIAATGVSLDMRPILRIRYQTWDALSVGKSTLRLPDHLASSFGRATITAPEFAAEWRSVCDEQTRLCEHISTLRKPRDLMRFLAARNPAEAWDERLEQYDSLKARLGKARSYSLQVRENVLQGYKLLKRQISTRLAIEDEMGNHFRSVAFWTDFEYQTRADLNIKLRSIEAEVRDTKAAVARWKAKARELEICDESRAIRMELDGLERGAELARLLLVRNAQLTVQGLAHTNHRPSAWWLPMVDSTGDWFRNIVATAELYTQPLLGPE